MIWPREEAKMRRKLSPALWLALLGSAAAPAFGGVNARLEAPFFTAAGEPTALRLSFLEADGTLTSQVIAFRLAATGGARFAQLPERGRILVGGGGSSLSAESEGGRFEVTFIAPTPQFVQFFFIDASEVGVDSVRRVAVLDRVERQEVRWLPRTLAGPVESWTLEEDPAPGPPAREGVLAWWSGELEPGRDWGLVSVPVRVPDDPSAVLRFVHRYDPGGSGCIESGTSRHSARVEFEAAPESWEALAPPGGHPLTVAGRCPGPVQGAGTFAPTSPGRYEEVALDLSPAAGREGRLRLRLSTDCEPCGSARGWFVDDILVESSVLSLEALDPSADDDADGLDNRSEAAAGTDPRRADTDQDGLADSAEDKSGVFAGPQSPGTDPLSPDTDGGGVPDGVEAFLRSDPHDAAVEPERRASTEEADAGGGRRWVLRSDGTAGESASDPIVELFRGTGGFRLRVAAAAFPPQGEAYSLPGGAPESGYVLGPALVGPFLVMRRVFASREHGFVRYLDSFENLSSKPQDANITLDSSFAPRRWVEVESTSDGSRQWTRGADHAHFNDRDPLDGMPVLVWRYSSPGARVEPSAVGLDDGVARVSFRFRIEPGERRAVLHFAAQSSSLAESQAAVAALVAQGGLVAAGLSPEDEVEVVNMSLDRDGDGMPGDFESLHGFDPDDPRDGLLDADGDGLSNAEEFTHSTDPRNPDTDGDGLSDGTEVHERGTDPNALDTDRDGLGDAQDPHPLLVLSARLGAERFQLTGEPATVEVRVFSGREPATVPLRFSLRLEGPSGAFEGPVEDGVALRGLGTAEVLLETASGAVRLRARGSVPGRYDVTLLDTESQGITAPTFVSEDFEDDDGGFVAEGPTGAWRWGEPAAGPPPPSGRRVWGTGLGGSYPANAADFLVTPRFVLGEGAPARLEVSSLVAVEDFFELAFVEASADGGPFEILEGPLPNTGGAYRRLSIDLSRHRGREVQFRFSFFSDSSVQEPGWFLDDFRVEGLPGSAPIEFLSPEADADGDGLDNAAELARGTDPNSRDTDADGLSDAVETGTGVFVDGQDTGTDPTAADTDGGGEADGSEVRARRNPHDPFDDQETVTFDGPFDTVPFLDGAGNEWQGSALGTAVFADESTLIEMLVLGAGEDFFISPVGVVTFGRQVLNQSSDAFFFPVPTTRSLFVSRQRPLLRWFDVITNRAARDAVIDVAVQGLIQDLRGVEVLHTSDGDLRVEPEDEFYVLALGAASERRYLGRVLRSAGAALTPRAASFGNGFETLQYALPVRAGGTSALLHFASFAADLASVEATLDLILRQDPAVFEGLDPELSGLAANFVLDSDGDGLPDAYERTHGLDPRDPADAAADADGDGLSNAEELALGTDPRNSDSDGDRLGDGEEVHEAGTDPLSRDTDDDRIPDGADFYPLHRLVLRPQREEPAGVAGHELVLRFRVETEEGGLPPPPRSEPGPTSLQFTFSEPVEVVTVSHGAGFPAGEGTFLFRPDGGVLAFSVRRAEPASLTVSWSERAGGGIAAGAFELRILRTGEDADEDGLSNEFEVFWGTEPLCPDTDGDGLGDGLETSSLVLDRALEIGTLPWSSDSDDGGARDPAEVAAGRDPFDAGDDLDAVTLPATLAAGPQSWEVLPSWLVGDLPLPGAAAEAVVLDNGAVLVVNGLVPPPPAVAAAALDASALRIGPVHLGSIEVSRFLIASRDARSLRFADTLRNPTAEAADVRLEIRFDLAGSETVTVIGTSTGDTVLDEKDTWVLLGQGGRRLLHVFGGAPRVRSVEVVDRDRLVEAFDLELAPGEQVTVLHLVAVGGPLDPLSDLARSSLTPRLESLVGLTAAEADGVSTPRAFEPVVWERLPRGPVAPGEAWLLEGKFLGARLRVEMNSIAVEPLLTLPAHLVFRAPLEPGTYAIAVLRPDGAQVLSLANALVVGAQQGFFRRGDADDDARLTVSDAVRILEYLFRGGREPRCLDAADSNDSGEVELSDAVALLRTVFLGDGPLPYPASVVPGRDPSGDALGCAR